MGTKINWVTVLIVVGACFLPGFVMAQDPGCGPDCPIDGGLGLLIAAGVGYGVKKYRDVRNGEK